MKRITTLALMTMGFAAIGMAAEFKGFVEDTSCSTKPGMKDNAACAKSCIKGGSPAVLVTAEGKVYKISNQDKIVSHAGENVTVTADLKGDTLTIDTVK
jgi:riboflavin synthase